MFQKFSLFLLFKRQLGVQTKKLLNMEMMTRLGVLDDAVSGKLISSQEVEKVDDNDEDNDSRI